MGEIPARLLKPRFKDGLYNAGGICGWCKVSWVRYWGLASSRKHAAAIAARLGLTVEHLIRATVGPKSEREIWVHVEILRDLAEWLPEKAGKQILDHLLGLDAQSAGPELDAVPAEDAGEPSESREIVSVSILPQDLKVEDGEIRISTVDIASWLERPHYNVTREVEKMLQEYENTQQLAALTCEASEYTDPTGRKLSMFVMDIRAAVKFVTRLKGQKPTIVRDKIVDAAFERYKQLNAEKSGASIAPSTLDALDLASKVKLQSAQELGDAYAQIELLAQRGKQGAATSFEQGQHWARCIEGFRKEIPALEDRKAQSARAELGAMRREVETLEKRVAEECAEKLASRQFANQETGRANLAEAALNALKQSGQGYEKLKAAHEALKTDYNDRVKRGEETLKRHKEQVEGLTASWQTERDARIEAEAKLSAEQKARANIGIDLKKLEDQIAASQEAIKFLEDALKAANDKLGGVAELAYGGRGEIERRLISHYEHGGKQEAADNIRARQAARHQKSQSYRNGEQLSLLNGRGNKAA